MYHKLGGNCIKMLSLTLVLLNMAGLGQTECPPNLVCLIIQTHQYNEMVMMNHNQECGHERYSQGANNIMMILLFSVIG